VGTLTIAGVEKDATLNLQAVRKGTQLGVTGTTEVLMTDFGIAPPKALMGMVRANPKVVIKLDLVIATLVN
jgi:polyisoprenoid-binding protein YceI